MGVLSVLHKIVDSLEEVATLITNLASFWILSVIIGELFSIGTIAQVVARFICFVVLPHMLSQIDSINKIFVT